jgi:[protein-PII] uridylyltransferase
MCYRQAVGLRRDLVGADSSERASLLRGRVEGARRDVAARLAAGGGGLETSAVLSRTYDEVILSCWDAAMAEVEGAGSEPMALVATGGWGRQEMCPYSDIDFILLTARPSAPVANAFAEHLLYPLWDAGIRVGHAIRAPSAASKLAKDDLATATALLDARHLTGEPGLSEDLARRTRRVIADGRSANGFIERLVAEKRSRHDRFGASLYLLEPNLKQGIGALRDLATGVWTARGRWGVADLAGLVRLGQLSARQASVLTDALDFLLKVRSLVHFHLGRSSDQLTFEIQEAIAPGMYPNARLPDGDIRPAVAPAVEALMRRYYLHARGVVQVTDRMIEYALVPPRRKPRIVKIDRSFVGFNGKLSTADPAILREQPGEMVRLFRVALEERMPIYAHTREVIEELLAHEPTLLAGDAAAHRLFVEALCDARDAGQPSLLEQMHDLGIINAILPEFAPCTCRVQHDLYHVYTVDQHQLYAVALLKRIARGELADEAPDITRAVAEVTRPVSLYLGTLLHDVGKPLGKGHADKGARLAAAVGRRLGLNDEDIERAEFLVRQHLTMAHLSQRRDLGDQQMVTRFVERVRDEETLRQLYALTYCDTAMTAPGNLNEWKAELLQELYRKAIAQLHGVSAATEWADESADARRVRNLVRQLCVDEGSASPDELDAFFRGLDDRYAASLKPRQIAEHYRLAQVLGDGGRRIAMAVTHRPSQGHSELAIAARDVHGLLAVVTGVLAAHRVDILGAHIGSRPPSEAGPGLALDLFFVRDSNERAISPDDKRWQRIEAQLEQLLAAPELDLDAPRALIEAKRSSGLKPRVTPGVPTEVTIDNHSSDDYTVIDVITMDRPGVLYAITRTLSRLGLEIFVSRVATEAVRVADVFYVQAGAPPAKITDAERLAAIRQALLLALAEVPQA